MRPTPRLPLRPHHDAADRPRLPLVPPKPGIGAVYRFQWQIELLFRELKGRYRLDQLPTSVLFSRLPHASTLADYEHLLPFAVNKQFLDTVIV
ncbi:MAG: hypothetical protein A2284_01575 [Deltaproteobacteria bacterium RIFOXYA12_FULL_61_11]|nr:MAG: hypothetical protein A2284_01575 [Deltaproteobacteria bacterium RIFOXYA12_FULL_61_11]